MDDDQIENALVAGGVDAQLSATMIARIVLRYGRAVMDSDRLAEDRRFAGAYVHSISFRLPSGTRDDVLMVVNGVDSIGTRVVGFHSDDTLSGCIVGGLNKLTRGMVVFRVDKYAARSPEDSD